MAKTARVFAEFDYQMHKSLSHSCRLVAKAGFLNMGENRASPCCLSGNGWRRTCTRSLYGTPGEMENRIKKQMGLFADRLSTDEIKGNQLRLHFFALAYIQMEALRRQGLKDTDCVRAQVDTIRLNLFKIGVIVRVSVRRILFQMNPAYLWKQIYAQAFHALRS